VEQICVQLEAKPVLRYPLLVPAKSWPMFARFELHIRALLWAPVWPVLDGRANVTGTRLPVCQHEPRWLAARPPASRRRRRR